MFWWVIENTLIAGTLAVAVAIASRSCRLSPALRHALWLVVLVKLITPPIVHFSVPIASDSLGILALNAASHGVAANRSDHDQKAPNDGLSHPLAGGADRPLLTDLPQPLETADPDARETASQTDRLETTDEPAKSNTSNPFASNSAFENTAAENGEMFAADTSESRPTFASDRNPAAKATLNSEFVAGRTNASGQNATRAPFNILRLLWNGWLLGTTCVVVLQSVRIVRLNRIACAGRPAPGELQDLVRNVASELAVRAPLVKLVDNLASPVLAGWGRPTLLWPNTARESWGTSALRSVVVHELAHLRRRDLWVGWLELLAGCGWWWHPLFWYVRRQLRENAELACDAWVVAVLPDDRATYAQTLIQVAERKCTSQLPAPALGIGGGSRELFERRLTMIMQDDVCYRISRVGLLTLGLAALVAIPGWTLAQTSPKPAVPAALPEKPETTAVVDDPLILPNPPEIPAREPPATTVPKPEEPAGDPFAPETKAPPGVNPGIAAEGPPAPKTTEERLSNLENQLAELLREIRASRQTPGTVQRGVVQYPPASAVTRTPAGVKLSAPPAQHTVTESNNFLVTVPSPEVRTTVTLPTTESVVLSRVTYKLPKDKAEALAAFIKEHVVADIDFKLKDDSVQITASSEDQAAIGQFVRLLIPRPTAVHTRIRTKTDDTVPLNPKRESFEDRESDAGSPRRTKN